jgi:hypothetical protein
MKNKELFDKTIGILVNAYMNDTLSYFDCEKCAVGNLIFSNGQSHFSWMQTVMNFRGRVKSDKDNDIIEKMEKTGYSLKQLSDIENAFNIGTGSMAKGTDFNYSGLMKVVDALMKIHEATTEEITEAKQLFVKV